MKNDNRPKRDIKRGEDDSSPPWLKTLLRLFQLICFAIALGGTLSGIVAAVQGRNDGALGAATIALYALVMATLAEWTARFIRRSFP